MFLSGLWIIATCKEKINGDKITIVIFTAVTQGVLISGTPIYANKLYKQLSEKKEDDNKENKNNKE